MYIILATHTVFGAEESNFLEIIFLRFVSKSGQL